MIQLSAAAQLFHEDCREALKRLPPDSVDSCVTDPPYALVSTLKRFANSPRTEASMPTAGPYERASRGFMGQTWDTGETSHSVEFWAEVYRVLKPGAFVAAFGSTRGYHRQTCAIEDAGFEIRDSLMWIYGTGFPKSHDVSKGVDDHLFGAWLDTDPVRRAAYMTEMRAARATASDDAKRKSAVDIIEDKWRLTGGFAREVVGVTTHPDGRERNVVERETGVHDGGHARNGIGLDITSAATPEAAEWEGWGTAIKPSFEPIVLARKPLSEPTVAANVLKWRTGALNIDASRIHTAKRTAPGATQNATGERHLEGVEFQGASKEGRWPANVVTDGSDEVVGAFPVTSSGSWNGQRSAAKIQRRLQSAARRSRTGTHAGSTGSAARFFYSAKASKADRNGSKHPTVKPIALMEWLCTLITPPGGIVLDPFAGSGTTGIAATNRSFRVVLVEREAEYVADILNRFNPPPLSRGEILEKLATIAAEFPDMEFNIRFPSAEVDIAPLLRGLARAARIQALCA